MSELEAVMLKPLISSVFFIKFYQREGLVMGVYLSIIFPILT